MLFVLLLSFTALFQLGVESRESLAIGNNRLYTDCPVPVSSLIYSIRCYQCSSADGKDSCGVYGKFDVERHVPVDCQGDEAVTPGTMCIKITQQSPRGFIWDGRWRQTIRRCTSVANTGVTGVCNWGIYENGVYWEECYCSEDGCNSSTKLSPFTFLSLCPYILISLLFSYI